MENDKDNAEATASIMVEVAYAEPTRQCIIPVDVKVGTTVKEAIQASGVLRDFPEIDVEKNGVGIFSKKTTLDSVLQAQDRIEIYRPLLADPKEVRRRRAAEGKLMRKGGGDEKEG